MIALTTLALASPAGVHGVIRGAIQTEIDDHVEGGAALELARLQAKWKPDPAVKGMLQVEGRTGAVELLDARVDLGKQTGPTLVVGRFKVPVGAELQLPAPELPTRSRGLLTTLVPRRAVGVLGGWRTEAATLGIGVFNPASLSRPDRAGLQLVVTGDFDILPNARVHIGGAVWEHPEDVAELLLDLTPAYDRQVDAALTYTPGRTRLLVEGLAAHGTEDKKLSAGARAVVAHAVPVGKKWRVEPALAWDTLMVHQPIHQGTIAATAWFDDRLVAISLAHRTLWEASSWSHRSSLAVQLWL